MTRPNSIHASSHATCSSKEHRVEKAEIWLDQAEICLTPCMYIFAHFHSYLKIDRCGWTPCCTRRSAHDSSHRRGENIPRIKTCREYYPTLPSVRQTFTEGNDHTFPTTCGGSISAYFQSVSFLSQYNNNTLLLAQPQVDPFTCDATSSPEDGGLRLALYLILTRVRVLLSDQRCPGGGLEKGGVGVDVPGQLVIMRNSTIW